MDGKVNITSIEFFRLTAPLNRENQQFEGTGRGKKEIHGKQTAKMECWIIDDRGSHTTHATYGKCFHYCWHKTRINIVRDTLRFALLIRANVNVHRGSLKLKRMAAYFFHFFHAQYDPSPLSSISNNCELVRYGYNLAGISFIEYELVLESALHSLSNILTQSDRNSREAERNREEKPFN